MKLSLVVAEGVHAGKVISVSTDQFLIGRDPHCNLRPASPAISKQHCGFFVRPDKVVLRDYGSTNGTLVNGVQITGEHEISNEDKVKVGPLEFVVRIEAGAPTTTVKTASRPAAKAVASAASAVAATTAVEAPAAAHEEDVEVTSNSTDEDSEHAAAMFLAMDDGSAPTEEAKVPDGTTVMDIPAMPGTPGKTPEKKLAPAADSSSAARDLLSKYMRRPRT